MAGDDNLYGKAGPDRLIGGGDKDTVWYDDASGAVSVNLATGVASGADGADTLLLIEHVVGSAYNDTIVGDSGPNHLFGGDGNDTIRGAGGTDNIYGQLGDDPILDGGPGDSDQVFGHEGMDGGANGANITGGAGIHDWCSQGDNSARYGAGCENDIPPAAIHGEADRKHSP